MSDPVCEFHDCGRAHNGELHCFDCIAPATFTVTIENLRGRGPAAESCLLCTRHVGEVAHAARGEGAKVIERALP